MAQLDGRKMFEEAMKFANENGRMLVDLEGKPRGSWLIVSR